MDNPFGPQPPNFLLHARQSTSMQSRYSFVPLNSPSISMFVNGVYYPNWHIYKQLPPSSLNFDVISHVFYSFAHVKSDGTVYLSDDWADDQIDVDGTKGCLRSFAALKAKYSVLRVVLCIGGGGAASATFPAAASTADSRNIFARTAKDILLKYDLDGIDIDWEHPSNSTDGANYLHLLSTLRDYLPSPRFILTTALPAGEWALRHINLAFSSHYLDLINVMAYDFAGPWVPTTEHQAQLYAPQLPHNQHCTNSCHSAISYFVSHGVPLNKLLLGVPTYGRSFLNSNGIGQSYSGHAGNEGTFEYRDLPRPGAREYVDETVGAAFCYGGDGGFVTYDNKETVKMKAGYVRESGLAGMFFWTGTGDKSGVDDSLVFSAYMGMHGR